MPKLKAHLQQEWERKTHKARQALAKRRREESDEVEDEAVQPPLTKKSKNKSEEE
jgi:hypothetical protein